jgi:hypothetical protein
MRVDDRVPADVLDLVALLYKADWTRLCLTAELAEFTDYRAYLRMEETHRPPWVTRPGQHPGAGPGRTAAGPGRPAGGRQWPADLDDDEAGDEAGPDELPTTREETRRLLLAPGGRFRLETSSSGGLASVRICDGQVTCDTYHGDEDGDRGSGGGGSSSSSSDEGHGDQGHGGEGHGEDEDSPSELSPARPPCEELLCPAWLPAAFALELAGSAFVAGRAVHRVIGRERPAGRRGFPPDRSDSRPAHRRGRPGAGLSYPGRIDALVDSELGILLRCERTHGGQVVSRQEITGITLDPPEAGDAQRFTIPAGTTTSSHQWQFSGPGWERAKTAASLGATAMSFAIRHAPHREPPAGSRPSPASTPQAASSSWPGQDEPVSEQILGLIYAAGLRTMDFDAELRTWADTGTAAEAFRRATRNTTLSGLSQLADAFSERATTWQSREAIRVGLPNRYRIDHIDGGMKPRASTTVATDGTQRWRVFPGHVTIGPARPLPSKIARLADPAWLLDWRLTGGAEVIEGGRRGLRIRIGQRWDVAEADAQPRIPVEAVIDAEIGVLLQLTEEQGGRPSRQQTLSALIVREQRDAAAFRIEIPAGSRVVHDTGSWVDEVGVPAPVQTAMNLAGKAVSGVAKVGSFLESLRQSARHGDQR